MPPRPNRSRPILIVAVALVTLYLLFRGEPTEPSAPVPMPIAPPPPVADVAPVSPEPARIASPLPPPPRPLAPAPVTAKPVAAAPDAGTPPSTSPLQLFGSIVRMGQNLELGEILAKNAKNADDYLDALCDGAKALREKPALRDLPHGSRDAARFMSQLVSYERPLDQPPGKLVLPEPLRTRLAGYGTDWPTKITDEDLAGLDFRWFQEAMRFDRWSFMEASRLLEQPPDFYREPIPNYSPMLQWSKLRYALGLRRGDVRAASEEVLHLADLIRTQGILIAEMIAIVLQRIDLRAHEAAAQLGLDVNGWRVPDAASLDKHRAVSFASMYFAWPGVKPETLRAALKCMPAPCSALMEGAGAHRSFGNLAATDNLEILRAAYVENGCEEASFERALATKEIPAADALAMAADDAGGQIAKFLAPKTP